MKFKTLMTYGLCFTTLSFSLLGCGVGNEEKAKLSFTNPLIEIYVNRTIDLNEYVSFDGELSDLTFTVENQSMATILDNTLLAKEVGVTTLSVAYQEEVATTALHITYSAEAASIAFDTDDVTIGVGESHQLRWTITPIDASSLPLTWTSTKPQVATVSNTGMVTGVSEGKTIIVSTTPNGLSAACLVTVGDDFPDLDTFQTPEGLQYPVKEKAGYQAKAFTDGLYLYCYQVVSETYDENLNIETKWGNASHVEFEIWNHDFGFGWGGTYVALWQDASYYINNQTNVKSIDTRVHLEDLGNGLTKVHYYMTLNFSNNKGNVDGPYAFVKFRFYDVDDNKLPYSDEDFVEYRDDRFVHTHAGNSYSVHSAIDGLDNPHQTTWKDRFISNFANGNFRKGDLTLFIGDSFFESQGWWQTFYNDYANKNAFTSAIGGTKSWEWIHYIDELITPFASSDGKIENIVVHLGYNEVNASNGSMSAEELKTFIVTLLEKIHTQYPATNIYYFGIGVSAYFKTSTAKEQLTLETDNLTEAYANTKDWLTFIDTDALTAQFLTDNPSANLGDFYKDGTHPKNENYSYFVDALEAAGCVITDL